MAKLQGLTMDWCEEGSDASGGEVVKFQIKLRYLLAILKY